LRAAGPELLPVRPLPLCLASRRLTVSQGLHKGNNGIFLCIAQSQIPNLFRVHVQGSFGQGPADLGSVAGRAGLVTVDGEIPIEKNLFAQLLCCCRFTGTGRGDRAHKTAIRTVLFVVRPIPSSAVSVTTLGFVID